MYNVRALVCNFCKLQKNLWCYVPLEWKSLGSCEIRENLGPATFLQVMEKKKKMVNLCKRKKKKKNSHNSLHKEVVRKSVVKVVVLELL